MKKRIFASVMALFMIFTLLSPVEVRAEENYGVSITLPEGAEVVELTDEFTEACFEGATLTISGCEEEIMYALAYYENDEYEAYGVWFYPTEEGVLTGDVSLDIDWEGTYNLVSVTFWTADDEENYIVMGLPESSITVVNNVSDREEPVITDVQMEDCGETFVQGQGEAVTITAKAADEGVGLADDGVVVTLEAANGEMVGKTMLKQEDGTYAATFYIDEEGPLYNTDWRVLEVSAYDLVGNFVSYYLEEDGLDLYFYVEDEDGYCDKVREDILLSFYDENYDLIDEFYVSSPDRTATLAELLDSIPEYESDLGFEGWRIDGTDIVVQDDTELLIPYSGY